MALTRLSESHLAAATTNSTISAQRLPRQAGDRVFPVAMCSPRKRPSERPRSPFRVPNETIAVLCLDISLEPHLARGSIKSKSLRGDRVIFRLLAIAMWLTASLSAHAEGVWAHALADAVPSSQSSPVRSPPTAIPIPTAPVPAWRLPASLFAPLTQAPRHRETIRCRIRPSCRLRSPSCRLYSHPAEPVRGTTNHRCRPCIRATWRVPAF